MNEQNNARCLNCEEGRILVGNGIVTHEMAIDAGHPEWEGMFYDDAIQCPCCMGEWQNCSTCGD